MLLTLNEEGLEIGGPGIIPPPVILSMSANSAMPPVLADMRWLSWLCRRLLEEEEGRELQYAPMNCTTGGDWEGGGTGELGDESSILSKTGGMAPDRMVQHIGETCREPLELPNGMGVEDLCAVLALVPVLVLVLVQ